MDEQPFYLDSNWWTEQALVWLVFTVLVTLLFTLVQFWLDRHRRAPYENWHLAVWGDDPPDATDEQLQALHWEEVMRMEKSAFERWKTVKSVLSGRTHVKLSRIDRAHRNPENPDAVWCLFDKTSRRLIVDLNRIPEEQRTPYATGSVPWDSPRWGEHKAGAKAAAPGESLPGATADLDMIR